MNPAVASAHASQPAERSSWLNRPFIMVWIASFVSVIGDGFSQIALAMWALQTTGAVLPMTVLLTTRAIVGAICGPIAGGLVDRMDRKTAMMIANGARALTTFGIAYLVARPAGEVLPMVIGLAVLGGIFGSLHEPARSASLVMIVGKDNLARAGSLMQLSGMAAMILGPVLGGIVVTWGGARSAMMGDAMTFVIALSLVGLAGTIANPPRTEARPKFWSSIAEGFQFLRQSKLIGAFVLVVAPLVTFSQSAIAVLFPVMAVMVWQVSGATYGMLQGTFALGFVIALVGLSIRGDKIRRRGLVWGFGMVSGGLLLGLMGVVSQVQLVFPIIAGVGLMLAMSNVVTQVAVQRETPVEVQGRVFGLQTAVLAAVTPMALSLVGVLSDAMSPAVITTGAGLLLAAVGLIGLSLPVIRRYELPPAPAKQTAAQ